MKSEPGKYRLVVRPGILKDGTYGVYAVPENNSAVEYQLDARFASIAEAREMAEAYLNFAHPPYAIGEIAVQGEREVRLNSLINESAEEKQEAALKAQLKKILQMPTSFKIAPFAKITETTPYLLSIVCLIIFAFSISVTIPTYIPLVGDLIGGKTLGPSQIARLFPFALLAAVIFLQIRVRGKGLGNAAIRDTVLSLALQHGWRGPRFSALLIDTMESENLGWLRKVGEWMQSWDPDTLRQVREDAARRQEQSPGQAPSEGVDLGRLVDEDFEARIHALYYMEKEPGFRSWTVIIHPLLFLMTHRRAVRRARALASNGLGGLLYLGKCSLPGGDDYRMRRRLFPIIVIWPLLMFGIPLVWAFVLRPWPTVPGIVGMVLMLGLILAPIILWNHKLMVECRGLPRGMSWTDIQGDTKLIRGL